MLEHVLWLLQAPTLIRVIRNLESLGKMLQCQPKNEDDAKVLLTNATIIVFFVIKPWQA